MKEHLEALKRLTPSDRARRNKTMENFIGCLTIRGAVKSSPMEILLEDRNANRATIANSPI